MIEVGSEFCWVFFKSPFAGFEVGSGPFAALWGAAAVALSGTKAPTPI